MMRSIVCITLLVATIASVQAQPPLAETTNETTPKQVLRSPYITLYHGKYTETDLMAILFRQRTNYDNSYITVLGYSYPLGTNIRWVNFEVEGQVGFHSGAMKHVEVNGFLTARTPPLFGLPFTLALGDGLSLASRNPDFENKAKGFYLDPIYLSFSDVYMVQMQNPDFPIYWFSMQLDKIESRHLLNYMMVEAEWRFVSVPFQPAVFMRVHHRSGVFGLYCPPDPACGSNYISYGVKFALE